MAPEIKLIFIAGTNYSGTTLLSSILGCHPEVESLGQVFEIEDYHRRGRKCMCGEEVPGCPFWSEVLPRTSAWHRGERRLWPYPTEFNYGGPITGRLQLVRPARPSSVAHYREFTLGLLRAASAVSGRRVLVDSSKHPHRLVWLVRSAVDQDLDLRVVQVTRNGLGVMRSYLKRGQSAARGALAWRNRNAQVSRAVAQFAPRRTTRLNYEELCADPRRAMERLCTSLGLQFDPRMLQFRSRVQHQVGGNPMRFRDEREISLDERWRRDLTEAQRVTFNLLAGAAQRALGYHD